MMKLSLLPVSYFRQIISGEMRISDFAREALSLGLDAIDISILFLRSMDLSKAAVFGKEVRAEGIDIMGASTYPDFTHPDPQQRKKEMTQLERDLPLLAEAGVKTVRVTAGQAHPDVDRADGMDLAFVGVCRAAETAKKYGLEVVFENHSKPGVWEYPDFDFPTDVFLELAERFRKTPVKIQFDTANPVAYGDDPMNILPHVVDNIGVVHAADTKTRGELCPSVIGAGLVNFREIFGFLKSKGFDGWISIEEASGKGAEGVKSAVNNIRKLWTRA